MRRSHVWTALALLLFCASPVAADDAVPPAPKKYALLIGLNDYRYAGSLIKKLEWAVNDATELDVALENQGYETTKLTNEDAKREHIVAELAKFASIVTEADTFLLYFAGHGVRNKRLNQKTYWLAYESNLAELDARGIRLPHLLDYLQDINAGKKLILLDHCFSGEIVTAEVQPGNTRDGAAELRLERGAFSVDDVTVAGNSTSRGFVVIAASERDAFEVRTLGHGIFTSVLLEALTSSAADRNQDGSLTLNELREYLDTNVPTRAQEKVGRPQQIVETASGRGLTKWIVGPNVAISAAKLKPIVDRYQAGLTAWSAQGRLTPEQKSWLAAKLNDWYEKLNANQPISARDLQVVTGLREILDSPDIPDDLKPNYLAAMVQL